MGNSIPILFVLGSFSSEPRFTAMPILFFGHIAAMLCCWCLMTSGSVARPMGSRSPYLQIKRVNKTMVEILPLFFDECS